MATYTAGDQINRALRLLGVLAEGETPSAETSADALMALNQMIDSWNTERLSVYATADQVVTWPAGQATRTFGPTGDLVGTRPVTVEEGTYFILNGISYPLRLINRELYDRIPVKTITSAFPEYLFVNMDDPDIELTVYPVPTTALELHLVGPQELSQPATLSTVLHFPPGYLRAFTYNLALELAPEFGAEPSADVRRVAMVSKRDLKRLNDPKDVMTLPYPLTTNRRRYNIFSGNY